MVLDSGNRPLGPYITPLIMEIHISLALTHMTGQDVTVSDSPILCLIGVGLFEKNK